MPHEDRRIIFSYEETYKAIYALCMQKEIRRPPPGIITSFTVDPANDRSFKVRIDNPQLNTSAEAEYSRDFVAAALMLFCRSTAIPIPKRANKGIKLKDDTVILHLTI